MSPEEFESTSTGPGSTSSEAGANTFAAHEELENVWRAARAQTSVTSSRASFTLPLPGTRPGAAEGSAPRGSSKKAIRRLGPFVPEHRGVDVSRLVTAQLCRDSRARDSLDLPPPDLP